MVEQTAKKGLKRLDDITELMQNMSQEIKTALPKLYSKELIDILFRLPYTKRQVLIDEKLGNPKTVGNYLMSLSNGIGKQRLFEI